MKKLFLLVFAIGIFSISFAQTDTTRRATATPADTTKPTNTAPADTTAPTTVAPATVPRVPPAAQTPATQRPARTKKDWSKVNLGNRSNDHLMVQIGYDGWLNKTDTMKTKGLSRSLNIYFMLDFPFKTDPRFSIGIGAGVSGSSMYFNKTIISVAGGGNTLSFKDVSNTNYYKKYKLATTYAEAPIELRFTADPENNSKSFKAAIGAKIGTMLNAHTKGKNLLTSTGSTLNAYTLKESSKRFFNGTRLAGTARIGYGVFSLFGAFQINSFLKDGAGPDIHPYSIGLTLSGL